MFLNYFFLSPIFKTTYITNPPIERAIPPKIIVTVNCVIKKRHERIPSKAKTGNLPMFKGILNGLFSFGELYRSTMTARLIIANVTNNVKFVSSAINPISLINVKRIAAIMTANIAKCGVRVFG